jgi:hypothetical protein
VTTPTPRTTKGGSFTAPILTTEAVAAVVVAVVTAIVVAVASVTKDVR